MTDTAIITASATAEAYLAALSPYRHGDVGPADPVAVAGGPEAP